MGLGQGPWLLPCPRGPGQHVHVSGAVSSITGPLKIIHQSMPWFNSLYLIPSPLVQRPYLGYTGTLPAKCSLPESHFSLSPPAFQSQLCQAREEMQESLALHALCSLTSRFCHLHVISKPVSSMPVALLRASHSAQKELYTTLIKHTFTVAQAHTSQELPQNRTRSSSWETEFLCGT